MFNLVANIRDYRRATYPRNRAFYRRKIVGGFVTMGAAVWLAPFALYCLGIAATIAAVIVSKAFASESAFALAVDMGALVFWPLAQGAKDPGTLGLYIVLYQFSAFAALARVMSR